VKTLSPPSYHPHIIPHTFGCLSSENTLSICIFPITPVSSYYIPSVQQDFLIPSILLPFKFPSYVSHQTTSIILSIHYFPFKYSPSKLDQVLALSLSSLQYLNYPYIWNSPACFIFLCPLNSLIQIFLIYIATHINYSALSFALISFAFLDVFGVIIKYLDTQSFLLLWR